MYAPHAQLDMTETVTQHSKNSKLQVTHKLFLPYPELSSYIHTGEVCIETILILYRFNAT